MAGAFAGMLSRVAVAPLDVIKIRMQVQVEPVGPRRGALGAGKYRGIAQCARTILKEEGARGLWAGTVPALFLWVPYTAVQFAALGEFKRVARENGGDPEKPPLAFAGGAVAGATATVVTYPFDVMRTVLAAQGSPRVYESLPAAAAGILKSRGPAGLYAGVGVTLLEIVPASAIQFGVYALLRDIARAEDPRSRDSTPRAVSPLANAACGFGAGSVARVIIHPLDVEEAVPSRRVGAQSAVRRARRGRGVLLVRVRGRDHLEERRPARVLQGPDAGADQVRAGVRHHVRRVRSRVAVCRDGAEARRGGERRGKWGLRRGWYTWMKRGTNERVR